jgi:hypothetical protein
VCLCVCVYIYTLSPEEELPDSLGTCTQAACRKEGAAGGVSHTGVSGDSRISGGAGISGDTGVSGGTGDAGEAALAPTVHILKRPLFGGFV